MILSDGGIRDAMLRESNALTIDPPLGPKALQPCSVDLSLGPVVRIVDPWISYIQAGQVWNVRRELGLTDISEGFDLLPGEFILASTLETVGIPTDLVGQLNGRSTWARVGLMTHTVSGYIDAGFKGQITLELKNVSNSTITLYPGQRLCNLVFMRMESPPERLYGSEGLGSHYQGQMGPTESAMEW